MKTRFTEWRKVSRVRCPWMDIKAHWQDVALYSFRSGVTLFPAGKDRNRCSSQLFKYPRGFGGRQPPDKQAGEHSERLRVLYGVARCVFCRKKPLMDTDLKTSWRCCMGQLFTPLSSVK